MEQFSSFSKKLRFLSDSNHLWLPNLTSSGWFQPILDRDPTFSNCQPLLNSQESDQIVLSPLDHLHYSAYIRNVKKYIAIVLGIFYGVFSVGLHLHMHYCCGNLAEMHISNAAPDPCCHWGEEEAGFHKNCCSTDVFNFTLEDEHYSSGFQLYWFPVSTVVPNFSLAEAPSASSSWLDSQAPPSKRRRFLEHCSLVFYAWDSNFSMSPL